MKVRKMKGAVIVVLGLLAADTASAQQERCATPLHRQFDFWIGDWDVSQEFLVEDGSWITLPARSTVRAAAGGCALQEQWRGQVHFSWEGMTAATPLEGLSVRSYDAERGIWRIWWLDSRRPAFGPPFVGRFEGGEGRFQREGMTDDGSPLLTRIRFHDITADTVRWELAVSRDDGSSWSPLWRMQFRRASSADLGID